MTRETVNKVMDYCEQQNAVVQITFNQGEWIADFLSHLHARVCFEELAEQNILIKFERVYTSSTARLQ